ncbi:MAG: PAS domain-containing protein [Dehalococcoidia bacterium]|nr:PAS domain-containing protein [Dehalococcoidia bacterium]
MKRDLSLRAAVLAAAAAFAGVGVGSAFSGDASFAAWVLEAFLIALLCSAAGYLVFFRPSSSLRAVARAADRIAAGEFGQRVPVLAGPAEDLTTSFNTMGDRVEELLGAVAAEHARLEAVFEAATDAMVAVTHDTTVCFLNPAAASIFGTPMGGALERPLIESARDYELDALVRRVAANGQGPETVVIQFGPNRTPLRAVAVPITNGGTWAVLLVLTDLTEVARVDQVRRDFLSNVSHELRTPLASIRALVETMEAGAVEPGEESDEFLRRIRLQVERVTALVNELLDLSRIESGAVELQPETIDVRELVQQAADLLRPRAESAGVAIVLPDGHDLTVEGDRASLLRVVSNLLDNAIKYSPPGAPVQVTARREGELAAIAVTDQGPGINAQDLPRVFERFYKGEASRATSGTGLGLAIVKHIVRAHGGTAEVVSAEGEGATFTVRLPRHFVGLRPAEVGRAGRRPGRVA